MPAPSDPYAILGVARDASADEIGRAHRRLAKAAHPDVSADPAGVARMRQINDAWHILSRPALRAAWDAAHPGPGAVGARVGIGPVGDGRSAVPAAPSRAGWMVLVVVTILLLGMLIGGVIAAAGRPTLPGSGSPGYHGNLP